jgi:hypothetical protein
MLNALSGIPNVAIACAIQKLLNAVNVTQALLARATKGRNGKMRASLSMKSSASSELLRGCHAEKECVA